jgi:hypothetical protein
VRNITRYVCREMYPCLCRKITPAQSPYHMRRSGPAALHRRARAARSHTSARYVHASASLIVLTAPTSSRGLAQGPPPT